MLITCSSCQAKIRVPDSAAGKRGKCPKCNTVITIPAGEETALSAAPPEPPAPPPSSGSPFAFDEAPEPEEEAPPPRRKPAPAVDEVDDEIEEAPPELDEDERPIKKRAGRKTSDEPKGLSLASMICGIVSLVFLTVGSCCCGLIPIAGPIGQLLVTFGSAVAAIVMGFMGKSRGGYGFALAGIIMGSISLVLMVIGVILVIVLLGANILVQGAGARMR